jgi:hypothetical protein
MVNVFLKNEYGVEAFLIENGTNVKWKNNDFKIKLS